MHRQLTRAAMAAIVAILAVAIVSCGDSTTGEGGEESGNELALDETYDEVRNGARLILSYDAQSNSFLGTVENTTSNTLRQVRVEGVLLIRGAGGEVTDLEGQPVDMLHHSGPFIAAVDDADRSMVTQLARQDQASPGE